ncbi:MAG: FlgD immunoglobulin-like domain containing protein, partial [Salinibacter sp.]
GAPNAVSLAPPTDAPDAPGLRIRPDPFSIERDGATRIRFTLREVPNLVRVRIYDARGRKVRTLEEARLTGRSGELVWNGRNDAGQRVRIGPYVVLFEAVRAEGGTVTQLKETVVVARPLN